MDNEVLGREHPGKWVEQRQLFRQGAGGKLDQKERALNEEIMLSLANYQGPSRDSMLLEKPPPPSPRPTGELVSKSGKLS